MLQQVVNKQEYMDTEKIAQWRNTSQILMRCGRSCAAEWRRTFWRSTSLRWTRKVPARGEPLKWQIIEKEKRYRQRKWRMNRWARIFSWFRKYSFPPDKRMQAELTEEEEVRQTRIKVSREWCDECGPRAERMHTTVGGLVRYWRLIVKKRGSTQNERIRCSGCMLGCRKRRRRIRKQSMEEENQKLIGRMISSAEGGAGFLQRITMRGEQERVGEAQPWRDEELRKLEEGQWQLKEDSLQGTARIFQLTTGVGLRRFSSDCSCRNLEGNAWRSCAVSRKKSNSVGHGRNKLARRSFSRSRKISRLSVPLLCYLFWLDGGSGCVRLRIKHGAKGIVLDGMRLMCAMKVGSVLLGKSCSKWKDFYFRVCEMDQGAITLVLCLPKAIERVSLPVAWASATHFNFLKMSSHFERQPRVHFGRVRWGAASDHHGHPFRIEVELVASPHRTSRCLKWSGEGFIRPWSCWFLLETS